MKRLFNKRDRLKEFLTWYAIIVNKKINHDRVIGWINKMAYKMYGLTTA